MSDAAVREATASEELSLAEEYAMQGAYIVSHRAEIELILPYLPQNLGE